MKLYKVLNPDGSCCHGGKGKWFLPKGNRPGKWMPRIKGELILCGNGYHLCRQKDLLGWLCAHVWEAEYDGELLKSADKVVVRRARLVRLALDDCSLRLFACDCAAHVLHLFEQRYPDDNQVRVCIETARLFATGRASADELSAAGAAWAAAGAAWAAAGAARAAWAAGDAAWAAWNAAGAARAAARAARDAAGAAAGADEAAERKWQQRRLGLYLRHGSRVKPWPLPKKTKGEKCED